MTSFTQINNSLLQGKTIFNKPAEKLTYLYLQSFINCEKVFPSIEKIAAATCQSERNAMRVIKDLEDLGAIKVKRTPGKSNVYTLVAYDEIVTTDKKSPAPVTKRQSAPVTESHTKTNNLLKTKNKNNISNTSESVMIDLLNQFPDVPVREIANELESDSSVVINTIAQFKGLLTYRVKNYKPAAKKPSTRKVTRTEQTPDWYEEDRSEFYKSLEQKDERTIEEKRENIAMLLKQIG